MPPSWKKATNWATINKRTRAKTYRIDGKRLTPRATILSKTKHVPYPTDNVLSALEFDTVDPLFEDIEEVYEDKTENPKIYIRKPTYGERKRTRNENWHKKQESLLSALRQYLYRHHSICRSQMCSNPATAWCTACESLGPMCVDCIVRSHGENEAKTHICRIATITATGMIWKAVPVAPWGNQIVVHCKRHNNTKTRIVTLHQEAGQQDMHISFCMCQDWNNALLGIGYWPTSPVLCRSAIKVSIMINFRAMNLQCGATAYTYANYLSSQSLTKWDHANREIYRPLQDAYRPFAKLFAHCLSGSVDHTQSVKEECPCCYYNLEKRGTASIDACFGAVGKAHQNNYPTKSFFGNDYMLDDLPKSAVCPPPDTEPIEPPPKHDCDRRSMREKLQTAGYYDGLNETGLFGSVCKHGIPLYFLNVRFGGEKMIFPSTILDKLLEGDSKDLLLKYDSICSFEPWRINRGMSLQRCKLALSAGHSLTHCRECQEKYDPTRVRGNGLHSGEEIESNWARLMHIWPRTREMSCSNRHDELSDHLAFLAGECIDALGVKLHRQFFRAKATLVKHLNLLRALRQITHYTESEVEAWFQLYKDQKELRQPDLTLSMIEEARLKLIRAHDDAHYWIQLMRSHEQHNYKMRTSISQHILDKCRLRREALGAYNLARSSFNPALLPLTLDHCERQGHLHKVRADEGSPDYAKHQHYDSWQLVQRAREEIAFTKVEVQSLIQFASNKIHRFSNMYQEAIIPQARADYDPSIGLMSAHIAESGRHYLAMILKQLSPITTYLCINTRQAQGSSVLSDVQFSRLTKPINEIPSDDDTGTDWSGSVPTKPTTPGMRAKTTTSTSVPSKLTAPGIRAETTPSKSVPSKLTAPGIRAETTPSKSVPSKLTAPGIRADNTLATRSISGPELSLATKTMSDLNTNTANTLSGSNSNQTKAYAVSGTRTYPIVLDDVEEAGAKTIIIIEEDASETYSTGLIRTTQHAALRRHTEYLVPTYEEIRLKELLADVEGYMERRGYNINIASMRHLLGSDKKERSMSDAAFCAYWRILLTISTTAVTLMSPECMRRLLTYTYIAPDLSAEWKTSGTVMIPLKSTNRWYIVIPDPENRMLMVCDPWFDAKFDDYVAETLPVVRWCQTVWEDSRGVWKLNSEHPRSTKVIADVNPFSCLVMKARLQGRDPDEFKYTSKECRLMIVEELMYDGLLKPV